MQRSRAPRRESEGSWALEATRCKRPPAALTKARHVVSLRQYVAPTSSGTPDLSSERRTAPPRSIFRLLVRYFLPLGLLIDVPTTADIRTRYRLQEANRRILDKFAFTFCRRLFLLSGLLFAAGSELPIEFAFPVYFLASSALIPMLLLVSAWIALRIYRMR